MSYRTLQLFARALRLRCPNCGGGPILESWFRMRSRCPNCALELDRAEEGYQVGAYMFNIIVAEFAFLGLLVAVAFFTWPSPPWNLLLYGGAGLMVIAPFLFLPFSRTLFLAFDLVFRPLESGDGQ